MRRHPLLLAVLAAAALAAGCGGSDDDDDRPAPGPVVGAKGEEPEAAADLGFPAFATKNTTRVGGADSIANAAGVARAVWPGSDRATRPKAVTLVDKDDWRAGVAAAALIAQPVSSPVLLSDGDELPPASREALEALAPTGSKEAGDAQVIRIGDVAEPKGLKATDVAGTTAPETAARIDALLSAARGRTSDRVVIAATERPEFATPAAGWAAKSGDPVLFTDRDRLPAPRAWRSDATSSRRSTSSATSDRLREGRARAAQPRDRRAHRGRHQRRGERDRVLALRRRHVRLGRHRSRPRPGVRQREASDGRGRRRPAVGERAPMARCCCTRAPRSSTGRWRATCSTSSPASARTPCAGSTITAG
jgi:hypothetical protein